MRTTFRTVLALGITSIATAFGVVLTPHAEAETVTLTQPSSKVAVTQGQGIQVPDGICSLTIVSSSTAYTAAHCSDQPWIIGYKIRDTQGNVIGTVESASRTDIDGVRIKLDSEHTAVEQVPGEGDSLALRPGSVVSLRGYTTPQGATSTVSYTGPINYHIIGGHTVRVMSIAPQIGGPGDSGGPVTNEEGQVVGLVTGGVNGATFFTPIHLLHEV